MDKIYSEERAWRAASVRPRTVTPTIERLASSFRKGVDRHERACWEGAVAPHALPVDDDLGGPFASLTKKSMIMLLDAVGVCVSMRMTRNELLALCEKYVPVPVGV